MYQTAYFLPRFVVVVVVIAVLFLPPPPTWPARFLVHFVQVFVAVRNAVDLLYCRLDVPETLMQSQRRVHQLEQTPICDLDWEQTPICVLNWLTNECDVCVLNLHSHFGFVFSILQ